MSQQTCRYCGTKYSGFPGTCAASPTKNHVAVADGKRCVWCGNTFVAHGTCSRSPSKNHQLDR